MAAKYEGTFTNKENAKASLAALKKKNVTSPPCFWGFRILHNKQERYFPTPAKRNKGMNKYIDNHPGCIDDIELINKKPC